MLKINKFDFEAKDKKNNLNKIFLKEMCTYTIISIEYIFVVVLLYKM